MRISDWSSDVCSSDLTPMKGLRSLLVAALLAASSPALAVDTTPSKDAPDLGAVRAKIKAADYKGAIADLNGMIDRSEERRVGKEWVSTCRSRGSPYH